KGRHYEQLEVPAIDAAPVAKQPSEGGGAGEPVSPIGADRDERNALAALDGKPRSTLGATTSQYPAPAGGLHAAAKAVGPLAPDARGLIGAFHDPLSLAKKPFIRAFCSWSCQGNSAFRFCG